MGEPAGIGPDITLAAWLRRHELSLPPFVLIADPEVVARRAQRLHLTVPIREVERPAEALGLFDAALPVLPISPPTGDVEPGRPSAAAAATVIAAIETGVRLIHRGEVSGVVTNPIAKSVLYAAGFEHPGHTELLGELGARLWGGRFQPVMMLASQTLRVVPLTVHIPLAMVPAAITAPLLIDTARITAAALHTDFRIASPRLAVAGLNPHAGESGTLGDEETRIIGPAIAQLRSEGLDISGPLSADTMFHERARARYDAAIAMYHDQALVPLKTLAFDSGVNVTLGLPFVRTSPDHGTAFDIAGSGKANCESLVEALRLADRLAANRARSRVAAT
jgi:4-hydroxythreonine-4-phosphate dehydrogenase